MLSSMLSAIFYVTFDTQHLILLLEYSYLFLLLPATAALEKFATAHTISVYKKVLNIVSMIPNFKYLYFLDKRL